jgi:exodeoxyribonuclease V gamma subunit
MRTVPHRVVCLVALDDGVFPRGTRVDGDDVLARRPRVGERDRRSEDRQLFLDAIQAAKENLVVLYTGADERTGAERPPAVPLGELLDVLDRTAEVPEARVRDRVVVRHPLQPFDARNFEPGRLAGPEAFSFDAASYAGSVAMRDGQREAAPFLTGPLPAVSTGPAGRDGSTSGDGSAVSDGSTGGAQAVELEKLIRFLEHPARGFLQQRLELRTADEEEQPSDAVPVAPDKLEEWAVGDRLLRTGLRGRSGRDAVNVELLRGDQPPGRLGRAVIDPIADNVAAILEKTQNMLGADARTVDLSVALPSGALLAGTVPRVYGDRPIRVEYSKLSAKHRIRAWVQLLALAASDPSRDWRAAAVGRGPSSREPVIGSFLGGVSGAEALEHLDALVRIYTLGLTRVLPAPPKTACAYATARARNMSPENASALAGKAWRTRAKSGAVWGEFDDGDHRRVELVELEDQLADPADAVPLPNPHGEPHLFGLLATTIWGPLLALEDLTG